MWKHVIPCTHQPPIWGDATVLRAKVVLPLRVPPVAFATGQSMKTNRATIPLVKCICFQMCSQKSLLMIIHIMCTFYLHTLDRGDRHILFSSVLLFSLFFFSIIYNLQKNDLLSNGTLKIGCQNKWKFLVKICPNSFLVNFGPLDSWLVDWDECW